VTIIVPRITKIIKIVRKKKMIASNIILVPTHTKREESNVISKQLSDDASGTNSKINENEEICIFQEQGKNKK